MTALNDKRLREIAEGLRGLAAEAGPEGVYDAELFCVLGIGEGVEPDYSDAWDVERLADLIDPAESTAATNEGEKQ